MADEEVIETPNETIESPQPEVKEVPNETPAEKSSLRDEIKANYKEAKEWETETYIQPLKKGKPKEIKSEFDKRPSVQNVVSRPDNKPVQAASASVTEGLKPPISLKANEKEKWNTLPKEWQETLIRRESEVEKKMTVMDEERHYGRKIKEVVTPYSPLFAMSNTKPEDGIKEMLNYAQILQMGNPQQKGQLLWQLAQRWNADMKFTPQVAAQPQNQMVLMQQELQKTKDELARLPETLKQRQEAEQVQSIIDAFANDPKNVHYEKVKPVMAALLQAGTAKDMQDAYDKACFADPELRTSLISEQQKAADEKRKAEQKAKADAARKAASSVTGSPGTRLVSNNTNGTGRSLKDDLRANYRAALENQN